MGAWLVGIANGENVSRGLPSPADGDAPDGSAPEYPGIWFGAGGSVMVANSDLRKGSALLSQFVSELPAIGEVDLFVSSCGPLRSLLATYMVDDAYCGAVQSMVPN